MKRCFKCKENKELHEFYKHPEMADGHLGKCKECTKVDTSENYADKREQYSKYERQREQTEKRKIWKAEYQKIYRKRYPEKAKCSRKTWYNIRAGNLIKKPCEVCGEVKVQAHHEDYSKPLKVIWLCFKHHRELHNQVVISKFL